MPYWIKRLAFRIGIAVFSPILYLLGTYDYVYAYYRGCCRKWRGWR